MRAGGVGQTEAQWQQDVRSIDAASTALAPATPHTTTGNTVEAHDGSGAQGAQKNIFEAAFAAIAQLFAPPPSGKTEQAAPAFDLGKLLGDILHGLFNGPPKPDEAKSAEASKQAAEKPKPKPNEPKPQGPAGPVKPDQHGAIAATQGTGSVKILPGMDDGVKGVKGHGQIDVSGSADLGGGTTARGAFKAETFAGGTARGGVSVGPDGSITAQGEVGVGVGVRAHAEGGVAGHWGSVSGYVDAEAQAYVKAAGMARLSRDGLYAQGKVSTGVLAGASAGAQADVLGLARGQAKADARSGAGADATATVHAKFDPPEAAFSAKAGAFAGARAGFDAAGTIAGVGYGVSAEAWAGVGCKAELDVGIKDGKFKCEIGLGIAVGVGVAAKISFSFDTKDIGSIITGVVGAAGSLLTAAAQMVGGVLKPVAEALGNVFKPFGDFLGGLFKAVGGLFGGGPGNGEVAKDSVKAAAEQAETPQGLGPPVDLVVPDELPTEALA